MPTYFLYSLALLSKEGNWEVQNFQWCMIPLFSQVLAPPYALIHTYKNATWKAAFMIMMLVMYAVMEVDSQEQ